MYAMNTTYDPKNNERNELITWIGGDGDIKKQLDYILISEKQMNWVNNGKQKEWQIETKITNIK